MKEKSSIEILKDFAIEKGFKFYTNSSVDKHSLFPNERYTASKYIVFDLNVISENLFFVFHDSYSTKAYTGNTYCGLFKLKDKCDNELKVISRDWIDYLSFKKRLKTGDKYIDKNVTIYAESDLLDRTIINPTNIRNFIDLNNKILALELVTIKDSMSPVPALNGNNLIALRTNKWILELGNLEIFIENGCELLKIMK